MIKLWTRGGELGNYTSIEAFAMTITKNLCIDRIRSKGFQTERIQERQLGNMTEDRGEKLEKEDFSGFVRKIIENLPEQQKAIMQMRDIEEMEYDQIAEVMELNINAIRVNLSRARKKVRDTILKIQGYELARN